MLRQIGREVGELKAKSGLQELAKQLGSVTKACRAMGSRRRPLAPV